ncbi:MAG TPA: ADOP family duplicated permease [Thermoanaerobaculia bacterium]|jgi:predicted permease|nr:ADOP family duplicated permease [Thermoanaerobaculia bacterium]
MRDLANDLRHAARALLTRPGYSLAALLTLALGIGATTAVFSALHGYLLRPLPYPDGDRLINVFARIPQFGDMQLGISPADYLDVRDRARTIAAMGMYDADRARLGHGPGAERVDVVRMTPSLFATLRIAPALGRAFTEEEGRPGRDGVVLLTDRGWRHRFGADRAALGRRLEVDGKSVEIVGVTPPELALPRSRAELVLPMAINPAARGGNIRGDWNGTAVARLRPDATPAAAERELRGLWRQFVVEHPEMKFFVDQLGYRVFVQTLRDHEVADYRETLQLLQVAALLVLLVAAANLAGLTLSRLAARGRELAVRSALGGATSRLFRLVAVENLLLAAAGGTAGAFLARLALQVAERRGMTPHTVLVSLQPDNAVIAVGLGLALLTGLFASLAPLWWLRRRTLEGVLRAERPGGTGDRGAQRFRSALVVGQVAVSLTLMVLVGLLGVSLRKLLAVDAGFQSEGVVFGQLARADGEGERRELDRTPLLASVAALPGVEAAGLTSCLPFAGCAELSSFRVGGAVRQPGAPDPTAHHAEVSAGLLEALRIPVRVGRTFQAADASGPVPAVVDEAFARRWFPGRSPLGQRLELGERSGERPVTIVGVVGRVRSQDLARDDEAPWFYTLQPKATDGAYLAVRMRDTTGSGESLRAAVVRADPTTTLDSVAALRDRMRATVDSRVTPMVLVGGFAGLATLLAAVGVYAVLALTVARRRIELGVRAALGADRGNLLRLVLGQGARLLLAGMGLGALLAIGASALVASLLFQVERTDPAVYLVALATLGVIGLVACWVPGARAAASDPKLALRED